MKTVTQNKKHKCKDSHIFEHYTTQPNRLPDNIREFVAPLLQYEVIEIYAYIDLNDNMNLASAWLILSQSYICFIKDESQQKEQSNHECRLEVDFIFDRSLISAVTESKGLSCCSLKIEMDSISFLLSYSYRQRHSNSRIIFILKQFIEGSDVNVTDADDVYFEAIAHPIKTAQAMFATNRMSVVLRLMCYLLPYKGQLGIGIVTAIIVTLADLAVPFVTMIIIDDIYNPFIQGMITRDIALENSAIIIAILAVVYLVRDLNHWIRERTMSILGEYVARDIRTELYTHIQKLSMNYFNSKQTGSLISRVSDDTDRLWDFLAIGIVEVTIAAMMIIGLCIALLLLDWRLGLIVVIPIPFLLWMFIKHSRSMTRMFTKAWRTWSTITEILSDTIPGIRVIKAFNRESSEIDKFNKHNAYTTDLYNQLHRKWTLFWPRILLILHLTVIAVWWYAIPRLFDDGSSTVVSLSFGTFLAFLLYMSMYFQPMDAVGMIMQMINRAISSAQRVFEVLDSEPVMNKYDSPIILSPLKGQVEFKKVSFAYDGIRNVINNISFSVKSGEMIGLVGASGAGKSTIINLIVQFYEHNSGEVLIDGVEIGKLDIGSFRQQIGMVMQDPYLFNGTILDNIRYANKSKSLSEVIDAAKAANAHDFICRLPHAYETMVGERGLNLSGGERQRISIARAIIVNPRILILDEATSSVDSETEKHIQDALDHLIEGRTVFAIAHRLSTLRKANRIFVLENGEIIEQGTHVELLSRDQGVYRRFTRLQHTTAEMYAV